MSSVARVAVRDRTLYGESVVVAGLVNELWRTCHGAPYTSNSSYLSALNSYPKTGLYR